MANTNKNTGKGRVRNLKVYDKIFLRGKGHHRSRAVLYPEIRLIGKWLQDCGFEPGQHMQNRTDGVLDALQMQKIKDNINNIIALLPQGGQLTLTDEERAW